MKDILSLTCLKIKKKWKNSLLFFFVLFTSFSAAIACISANGSIALTNREYRLNTYGEWYFAIPDGKSGDEQWLLRHDWVQKIGVSKSVGKIPTGIGVSIGTVDDAFIDVGRIRVEKGAFPAADNEIAVDKSTLSSLGYDYTLGQKITLDIAVPCEISGVEAIGEDIYVEKTYTLCGILKEYNDLWSLQYNQNSRLLNGAIITEGAASDLLETAKESLVFYNSDEITIRPPVDMYFITVDEDDREDAKNSLGYYLFDTGRDNVCINHPAYNESVQQDYESFYVYIIAFLTFASILCLGIIQLPAEAHSFSVMRSVGMTKGQLALMQLFEALILGIPAILLGVPAGVFLTKLLLRLMLFSGSVAVQAYIPYDILFFILGLWLAAILLSRLVIYILALRVPMVGGLKLNRAKARTVKILRSGFIIFLLCVFSFTAFFSAENSSIHFIKMFSWENVTPYDISKPNWYGDGISTVLPSDIEGIGDIPGISAVRCVSEMFVGLTFDGCKEKTVAMLVIDEDQWRGKINPGKDEEAFHNGEKVMIVMPERSDLVEPEDEATIRIYTDAAENHEIFITDDHYIRYLPNDPEEVKFKVELIAEITANTEIFRIDLDGVQISEMPALNMPYGILCSERFFGRLLEKVPKGTKMGFFIGGQEYPAYNEVNAYAELNAENLSTDYALAEFCKSRDLFLSNRREMIHAMIQEQVQSIIMLFFLGGCVCLISLIIMCSNVSLETGGEKRGFLIKRCIGMSKKQAGRLIFGKSLLRCAVGTAAGRVAYIIVEAITAISEENGFFANLCGEIRNGFNGVSGAVALVCLIIPLILMMFIKRSLRKDSDVE